MPQPPSAPDRDGTRRERLLFVGWQGADWRLLQHRIDRGEAPTLRRLIDGGAMATLGSVRPLHPVTQWTSLATGVHACRHGLVTAHEPRPDGGGVQPIGQRSWCAPAMWEVLQAAGLRTATVNWPATAPADRWPGIHVDETFRQPVGADFDAWPLWPHCIQPHALREKLADLRIHPGDDLSEQLADLVPGFAGLAAQYPAPAARFAALVAATTTVHAAATQIAVTEAWDALFVCYDLLPAVTVLAGLTAPSGDAAQPGFEQAAGRVLRLLDMMLARLIELAGETFTTVLASPAGYAFRQRDGLLLPSLHGVLVARGDGIAADALLPGLSVLDVAPTLCTRFGVAMRGGGRVIDALAPAAGRDLTVVAPTRRADPAGVPLREEAYPDSISRQDAMALEAISVDQWLGLAESHVGCGEAHAALPLLQKARRLRPTQSDVLAALARCHGLLADHPAALATGQALWRLAPVDPRGPLAVAAAAAMAGEPHAGDAAFAAARDRVGGNPELLSQLGGVAMLRDSATEAEALFQTALSVDPMHEDALFGLAAARHALGDLAGADAALRRLLACQWHYPRAHALRADVLNARGDVAGALRAAETALDQDPHLREAAALLARLNSGIGTRAGLRTPPADT